jgi:cystathionine beta-lyase/cystathionine gamma-synthase
MQQAFQNKRLGLSIQEGGVKLTLDGMQDLALRLSPQQARALACDLIQQVNRVEKINELKKKNVSENHSIASKV